MAVIRCAGAFKTMKELIFKILNTAPKDCYSADVVADSYRTLFKSAEANSRFSWSFKLES